MSPFEPSPGRKEGREYFAGRWADAKFGTEPWLMISGIALGFAAAAREIWNLARKSEAIEKEKKKDKEC
jgi:F0F1-type ATP synthase assembly protein I